MANKFKEAITEAKVEETSTKSVQPKKKGLRKIARMFKLPASLTSDSLLPNLPFLAVIVALAFIYIGNTYRAEKRIRAMNAVTKEIKEMRTEYIATKSELMQSCRASAVAQKVKPLGIAQATVPPGKIVCPTPTKN